MANNRLVAEVTLSAKVSNKNNKNNRKKKKHIVSKGSILLLLNYGNSSLGRVTYWVKVLELESEGSWFRPH